MTERACLLLNTQAFTSTRALNYPASATHSDIGRAPSNVDKLCRKVGFEIRMGFGCGTTRASSLARSVASNICSVAVHCMIRI